VLHVGLEIQKGPVCLRRCHVGVAQRAMPFFTVGKKTCHPGSPLCRERDLLRRSPTKIKDWLRCLPCLLSLGLTVITEAASRSASPPNYSSARLPPLKLIQTSMNEGCLQESRSHSGPEYVYCHLHRHPLSPRPQPSKMFNTRELSLLESTSLFTVTTS